MDEKFDEVKSPEEAWQECANVVSCNSCNFCLQTGPTFAAVVVVLEDGTITRDIYITPTTDLYSLDEGQMQSIPAVLSDLLVSVIFFLSSLIECVYLKRISS